MKLQRYLTESENILSLVEKNCSQIIKEYKKADAFLYRGLSREVIDWIKVVPRTNRKPRDMPIDAHNALDKAFKKKFGWKARSEGVFVSPDKMVASYFSYQQNINIFFPFDGYKYVWSRKIEDLHTEIKFYIPNVNIAEQGDFDHLVNEQYIEKGIQVLLHSKHEASFKCKAYYILKYQIYKDILKIL